MRKDWEIKPFGKVCEIVGGSQPPKKDFIYEPKEGYTRLIQVRDYRTNKYITYIPTEKAKRFCSKSDIMIGRYGPPIFGVFRGLEGAYNVALMKAIPDEKKLDCDYFYWFLKTDNLVRFVEKTSKRAVGQDGVRKERLYTYPVPLPPLPEQKRIVSILDKAFIAIAKAKANAEQNLKNAKELFESYLQGVFGNKGEGWEEKKLGEVCHVKGGKRLPKGHKLTSEDTGLPYIRARDLKQETVLVEQTLFLKPETQNLIKNYTVKAGDVYITIVGVNIGDVGTIPAKMAGANLTENAAKIIIKNSISNIYLVKWLTSETSRRNIIRATMAAAQGKLALTRIKDLPIFYPPPEIQDEILTKINNLSFETKKIETIYHQKIENFEELKKSILQKAFNGELKTK